MWFPGFGQLYSGDRFKGLLLVVIYIALDVIAAWSFISDSGSVWIGIACLAISFIAFLYSLFDACTSTKRSNPPDFEQARKGKKDAWLAVFLSQLFPGIGHFYLKRWLLGIVWLFM